MAFAPLQEHFSFRDSKGNVARVSMYAYSDNAGVTFPRLSYEDMTIILGDILTLTNAVVVSTVGPLTTPTGPLVYGAAIEFSSVFDKAVFVFQDTDGIQHGYQIPAPLSTIFAADFETIDNTNANVKQFIADMTNTAYNGTNPNVNMFEAVHSRSGLALSKYVGGYRRRAKMTRRTTLKILTPSLSAGLPEE